jgi:hypothetical protein
VPSIPRSMQTLLRSALLLAVGAMACGHAARAQVIDGQAIGADIPDQDCTTAPIPSQNQSSKDQTPAQPPAQSSPIKKINDRIFGVMPNYLTVNGEQAEPLNWKGKYKMTAEGAFDPYEFGLVGAVAGIHQAQDADEEFGQGAEGYAKRYGSGFADQAIGNMMTGAVFPSLLRTDPRYYRMGNGSFGHRMEYAVSRIFVTLTDTGRRVFNAPEFMGNAAAAGISNLYYPSEERRLSNNLNTFATQISIDALGNTLKEFWPDIHEWLKRRK